MMDMLFSAFFSCLLNSFCASLDPLTAFANVLYSMPALSSASPREPKPVANLSPKSHVLSSPLAIFLMSVSTELPDWLIASENSLMLAFASCADLAKPTSSAPATVKAMPHGPPKAANSPLPMLLKPAITP